MIQEKLQLHWSNWWIHQFILPSRASFQHFRPDNVSAGGEIRFLSQILFLKYNTNEKVKTLLLCPYEQWSGWMFVLKGIKTVAWLRTNNKLPSINLHEFNCTSPFLATFNDNFHSPPFFGIFLIFHNLLIWQSRSQSKKFSTPAVKNIKIKISLISY